jgi:hypothetical protein
MRLPQSVRFIVPLALSILGQPGGIVGRSFWMKE